MSKNVIPKHILWYTIVTQNNVWGIKMSSNIKNVKYKVELKLALCFTMAGEEIIEHKIIDNNNGYPYNIKQKTVNIEDRPIPVIPKDAAHRVDTTLKSYEQIPCKINGCLTSILLDEASDEFLLHSRLLEEVQNENARGSYYMNSTLRKVIYLAYGFEYQEECKKMLHQDQEKCKKLLHQDQEECEIFLHQYNGYLTDFDRNVECFNLTGSMFHGTVKEINMDMPEITRLVEETRKNLQKIRK